MKNRLVLWGSNAQNEKVLITMELRPDENKVDIQLLPDSVVTEDLSEQIFKQWRIGGNVDFPAETIHIDRELTVADSLLPDDIRPEKSDSILRAQTEWHFIVLSSKLNQAYTAELDEIKEKVAVLEIYDAAMWDQLKGFWNKVQNQVSERNLFKEDADILRGTTNELFTKLKSLRANNDNNFKSVSTELYENFIKLIEGVEEKASKGLRINVLFEELKDLQKKFRDLNITKEHRSKIWDRIDVAFKNLKSKGNKSFEGRPAGETDNAVERINRRMDGLVNAIKGMQSSIDRDKDDLNFQNKKIAATDGQLEAQIRQAKIMMIEERIRSKEEKLKEMLATKTELDGQLIVAHERENKRKEREKVEEAKKLVQSKIADSIKEAADSRTVDAEKLEKAAEALSKKPVTAVVEQAVAVATPEIAAETEAELTFTEKAEDVIEDAVDTVKAVATVVGEKVLDFIEDLMEPKAEETPVAEAPTTDESSAVAGENPANSEAKKDDEQA